MVPRKRHRSSGLFASLPLYAPRTLSQQFGYSYWQQRIAAWLIGAFAMLAMLLAAIEPQADGQIYNLGSAETPINLLELAKLLVKINKQGHYQVIPFPPERKAIDIGDYYADFTKARNELLWQPQVLLADGLERSLKFYRENLDQYL